MSDYLPDVLIDLDDIFREARPPPPRVFKPRAGPRRKRPGVKKLRKRRKRTRKKRRPNFTLVDKVDIVTKWQDLQRECLVLMEPCSKREFCDDIGIEVKQLNKFIETVRAKAQPPLPRPSLKERTARSAGSGSKVDKLWSTPDPNANGATPDETLLNFVKKMRGTNPSDPVPPVLNEEQRLRELKDRQGCRLYIEYIDLVDRLQEVHEKVFLDTVKNHDKLEDTWRKRVALWCKRNKIVYRTPNATTLSGTKGARVAAEVERLLDQTADAVAADNLRDKEIANLDETALRILALEIRKTLAWLGQKEVLKEEHGDSRLNLSCPVVWWADGRMDIIVVWETNRANLDTAERWRVHEGIMFFEAYSKWAAIESYHRILRYFFSLESGVKLFFDDDARGHKGPAADLFLASIGAKRFRIPGGSTWVVQAADHTAANKVLKALARNAMRRHKLRLAAKDQLKGNLPASLTVKLKNIIGKVLSEVKAKMSEEPIRKKIARAFQKTLLARVEGNEPISKLAKFLEQADHKLLRPPLQSKNVCPKCGHMWATRCDGFRLHALRLKTKKADPLQLVDESLSEKVCYLNRPDLLPPLREQSPVWEVDFSGWDAMHSPRAALLNAKWTPRLVAVSGNKTFFLGDAPNEVYRMSESLPWSRVVKPRWWNEERLTYREPTLLEEADFNQLR